MLTIVLFAVEPCVLGTLQMLDETALYKCIKFIIDVDIDFRCTDGCVELSDVVSLVLYCLHQLSTVIIGFPQQDWVYPVYLR